MTRSRITQCPGTPAFMPPEALRAKPRYSDKLDIFSTGVLIIQIITRKFPAPSDAEIIMDDPTTPTGEKIVLIPELERHKSDINMVPSAHPLLSFAKHCLKDRDRERPDASQLCQNLTELKAALNHKEDKIENQQPKAMMSQTRASLKAQKEDMEELGESEEREVAELRQSKERVVAEPKQLQSLQMKLHSTPASSHQQVRRMKTSHWQS